MSSIKNTEKHYQNRLKKTILFLHLQQIASKQATLFITDEVLEASKKEREGVIDLFKNVIPAKEDTRDLEMSLHALTKSESCMVNDFCLNGLSQSDIQKYFNELRDTIEKSLESLELQEKQMHE